jgi:hypothetical protein
VLSRTGCLATRLTQVGAPNRDTHYSGVNGGAAFFSDLGYLNVRFSAREYEVDEGDGRVTFNLNRYRAHACAVGQCCVVGFQQTRDCVVYERCLFGSVWSPTHVHDESTCVDLNPGRFAAGSFQRCVVLCYGVYQTVLCPLLRQAVPPSRQGCFVLVRTRSPCPAPWAPLHRCTPACQVPPGPALNGLTTPVQLLQFRTLDGDQWPVYESHRAPIPPSAWQRSRAPAFGRVDCAAQSEGTVGAGSAPFVPAWRGAPGNPLCICWPRLLCALCPAFFVCVTLWVLTCDTVCARPAVQL